MSSADELIKGTSESIRKILQDRREAQAVNMAKLRFKCLIRQLEAFLEEDDAENITKLQMLEIEVDAATTKKDVSELLKRLSEIRGKEYP